MLQVAVPTLGGSVESTRTPAAPALSAFCSCESSTRQPPTLGSSLISASLPRTLTVLNCSLVPMPALTTGSVRVPWNSANGSPGDEA